MIQQPLLYTTAFDIESKFPEKKIVPNNQPPSFVSPRSERDLNFHSPSGLAKETETKTDTTHQGTIIFFEIRDSGLFE